MSTPDPKIDPKTLTHDQLRLELAHRLSEADMGISTDDELLQAYADYDGHCLLADNYIDEQAGGIAYDGDHGVKVLVEWAKQLTGEQELRLIETLAYAPGNAHSSR